MRLRLPRKTHFQSQIFCAGGLPSAQVATPHLPSGGAVDPMKQSLHFLPRLVGAMLCLCAFGMSKVHAQTSEHPIYVWTQGSIADSDPDNDNYEWHNPANWECEGNPGVPPTNAIVQIGFGFPEATGHFHI